MKRNYIFEWYDNKDTKYGKEPIIRHTNIRLSKPTGETGVDAKSATDMFTRNFGNLNKVTILKIKEIGEHGQIGEDIIPQEEESIVPIG